MKRKQFTFYASYYDAVKVLPKREQVEVILAICAYALEENEPSLTGTAAAIFSLARPTLDASRRKAESGQKGGKQTGSKTEAKRKQNESKTKANCKQTASKIKNKKEKENEIEIENECSPPCEGPPSPAPAAPVRHTRSQNGWVKLTDEEYAALVQDLGQAELDRCIAYVDEFAQLNGNKQKWKDWNLVIRKCSRERWGINLPKGKNVVASANYKPSELQKAALAKLVSGE